MCIMGDIVKSYALLSSLKQNLPNTFESTQTVGR
jgi:hypothetical protein